MTKQTVSIVNAEGQVIYSNLVLTDSHVLRFASGGGFIEKDHIARNNWQIKVVQ